MLSELTTLRRVNAALVEALQAVKVVSGRIVEKIPEYQFEMNQVSAAIAQAKGEA